MGCQCNIAAHDNVFNKSVLGGDADYFSTASDIANILNHHESPVVLAQRKSNNLEKINSVYNWDKVISRYEKLFLETMAKSKQND